MLRGGIEEDRADHVPVVVQADDSHRPTERGQRHLVPIAPKVRVVTRSPRDLTMLVDDDGRTEGRGAQVVNCITFPQYEVIATGNVSTDPDNLPALIDVHGGRIGTIARRGVGNAGLDPEVAHRALGPDGCVRASCAHHVAAIVYCVWKRVPPIATQGLPIPVPPEPAKVAVRPRDVSPRHVAPLVHGQHAKGRTWLRTIEKHPKTILPERADGTTEVVRGALGGSVPALPIFGPYRACNRAGLVDTNRFTALMSQRPQIVHARFVPEERVSCAVGDRVCGTRIVSYDERHLIRAVIRKPQCAWTTRVTRSEIEALESIIGYTGYPQGVTVGIDTAGP